MRVLIAFDKFKDSLTAPAACAAAAAAIRAQRPDWTITQCPLTDGGEGFAAILTRASGGQMHQCKVKGPRGQPIEASIGLVERNQIPSAARNLLNLPADLPGTASIALIEMATASGLALLPDHERDPWQTTTFGTGELIRFATRLGAAAILLGVGGSATNDLGLGALNALGLQLLDAQAQAVTPPVPQTWPRIVRMESGIDPATPPIRIACDVANPLLGPTGAAAIYGPQKGLRAADLARLETASARLAALLCAHLRKSTDNLTTPGAGAAGGIAFGLMTAANAQLLSGNELVAAWLDLDRHLAQADLVITGEGRFDASSLSGKGPGALATRSAALGKSVHVFAGQIDLPAKTATGLQLHPITPVDMPLSEALSGATRLLTSAITTTFSSDV
jgi:glycerate 2-kinase